MTSRNLHLPSRASNSSLIYSRQAATSAEYLGVRNVRNVSNMHVRAISFGTIPRLVARAFKVPLYGAGVGAGALTYANYKLEGQSKIATSHLRCDQPPVLFLSGVRTATSEMLDGLNSTLYEGYDRASNLFGGLSNTVASAAGNLGEGLEEISSGVKQNTDGFLSGFSEWWGGVRFGSSKNSESPPGQPGTKHSYEPVPPPLSPNGNGKGKGPENDEDGVLGGGAAALAALTSAYLNRGTQTEDEDKDDKDDEPSPQELLQLTRKLIEIRQVLLSVDQSDALKLPSIVVIGSQSSGKSSVLEAIVGHEFLPK
jgi:hypothetical protein